MDWLASIEVHSEVEASNKELLLSEIEYLESLSDCQHNALIKSIPKQKIQDKIMERKYKMQQEYKNFENDETLIVLQELLEDKESEK